jgi:hypothetical protein
MNTVLRFTSLVLATTVIVALPQRSSIRQIDFRNFVYPWDEPDGPPSEWHWMSTSSRTHVRLVDGTHRFWEPSDSELEREMAPGLWMTSVTYGDLDGDQEEEAAVALNYSGGGTANWDYLYVYKLEHGVPRLLGRLESGSRADGGLVKTTIENGLLVLDFADAARRVGDCCSEGFIRVRYRWSQGHFVETGPREHGDLKLEVHPGP